MNESEGYVVYFFPQALEALGDAIKPYLREGPGGEHVLCHEVDTAGSLIEMTMRGTTGDGKPVALELMVPTSMVRMIVSSQSDGTFGFGPRAAAAAITTALPPVGPTATPATAQPASLPEGSADNESGGAGSVSASPAPMDGAKPAP